jgi:two-component system, chemotaxis family, CheB/CheR fusion protein
LGSGRKKPTTPRSSRPSGKTPRFAPPLPRSEDAVPTLLAEDQGEPQVPPPQIAFPIVGVGASAGGLDAFRQLLGALQSNTGMAYVLVQHLAPRHESILAELLAKGSRMPVAEVKGDTAVEANHVYVTPGQHDVALAGKLLTLVPRTTTGGRHLPIDSFLRTLAAAQGSQAIGVILSGTGSDGTLGAKGIKEEGGIVFAQDPASAAYDSMPRSAIASGSVDFILPPERIAQELLRLSHHPYVVTPREERAGEPAIPTSLEKDGFRAILALLRKTTGADFSAYKAPTIKRRIARRMVLARIETLEEYARYLEGNSDEVRTLYQDCLIRVTSFFRDPATFQVLGQDLLPRLVKERPPGAPLRVWVSGCATGEEVYSIVICLLEAAGELKTSPSIQVFGTDLSESALETARAGRYLPNIAQDVAPERLRRFFNEMGDGYQVIKTIRDLCIFARHDVTRDPPFSRMDLVSCRNTLIYLEPRLQQRVIALFHYALLPSGFLVLGASETPGASQDLFAPVDRKHRIYFKRPAAAPAVLGFGAPRGVGSERQGEVPAAAKPGRREELPREVDRILLARYAPAGVVVDVNDNIVEFRGATESYLEHTHGRASLNLFKMVRKGLLLDIRRAVQEARNEDAPVRKEGLSLRQRGQVRRLDLEVVPLRGTPEAGRSLLLLFEARPETKSGSGPRADRRPRADLDQAAKESAKLRQDLGEATRYLQDMAQQHEATVEELQASSEEVLSANEELQSINEELETAKEELQASNEELATLNHELQDRNLELGRALEYANGIVETVRNPMLILDVASRVERANRTFYDYFHVAPEETVGKLVHELGAGQWDIAALRQTLSQTLSRADRVEDIEVEHDFPRVGRRTLVINARKLRREAGQESILLAFEDRTAARITEKEREALLAMEQLARQRAEQADRIKDEFVATLSHELRGPLNAMVGWVHALSAGGIDGATRERGMAAIERGVKAQARLIEDLLAYSTVVAGKLRLAAQLMDLGPVADAAVEAVRSAAEAKGIGLELSMDAKVARVYGDPDRLQQIIWNLLSNAVKFTPGGGRVEVWIGRVEKSLHIRVSDTGQGISPDFLPHVFERFRQHDGTSQRMHGGLGLGLAIVKELVELHGGTVHADSPGDGQGATFTVALPVPTPLKESKDSEGGGETEASAEMARTGSDQEALEGVRVLVVEDDGDTREMLVTVFEQCGARVSAVASAGEAMEVILRTASDVLVCDIGLAGEDGHGLIRKVRALEGERGGRIPALALTAYAGAVERGKALAAGFDRQVAKPAVPAELVAQVALLAGRRGRP